MKTDAEIDVFLSTLDNMTLTDIKKFIEEMRTPATAVKAEEEQGTYLQVAKELVFEEMMYLSRDDVYSKTTDLVRLADCIARLEDTQRKWEVLHVD